jgi:hypothetical protein
LIFQSKRSKIKFQTLILVNKNMQNEGKEKIKALVEKYEAEKGAG